MEIALRQVLFLIVALAGMLIIISFASMLNPGNFSNEKQITGKKDYITGSLADFIYQCLQSNSGRPDALICFEVSVSSDDAITPEDVLTKLRAKGMDTSKVHIEALDLRDEIIIRYENENIYVRKREKVVE